MLQMAASPKQRCRRRMTVEKVPPRFQWALDQLNLQPSDRILEIGCGRGVLLSLIVGKLTTGTITAIDRSEKMVAAASKLNATAVAAGRAEVMTANLANADLGEQRFSKILAFNVNVFWLKPQRELATTKRLLRPEGSLHLFFDPPSPAQVEPMLVKLKANLDASGFHTQQAEISEIGTTALIRVKAAPLG
ncbi:class I SAM-dependent methyltransferase [Pseudaminobacter sp. NGMCC 1.201702]|uniref:class I SAM-dependent methyltransferase n=1 Tax=Pseudaminobacter sp. NGMCC 1.201702 TaxID=3391825 RepID=UPI0039EF735C